jgi:hypothetical protein
MGRHKSAKTAADEELADETAGTEQAAETAENPHDDGFCYIYNRTRRNSFVYGLGGGKVVFDENGTAKTDRAQFDYFVQIPGYKAV